MEGEVGVLPVEGEPRGLVLVLALRGDCDCDCVCVWGWPEDEGVMAHVIWVEESTWQWPSTDPPRGYLQRTGTQGGRGRGQGEVEVG